MRITGGWAIWRATNLSAGRQVYTQLLIRYSAPVPADELIREFYDQHSPGNPNYTRTLYIEKSNLMVIRREMMFFIGEGFLRPEVSNDCEILEKLIPNEETAKRIRYETVYCHL